MDAQKTKRAVLKSLFQPLVRWSPLDSPVDGYSLVLGTPWELRHLLGVNLEFVRRQDLEGLDRVIVVFDRRAGGSRGELAREVRARFPELDLTFHDHPAMAARLARRIHQSKFYASLNWTTGIAHARTRYAIMHDFDLFPIQHDYFRRIHEGMRDGGLRFGGAELTYFDGLEDADRLIGTWNLGIDVAWLRRNHGPVDCFHAVADVNGRRVDLDAFSLVQSRTELRGLVDGVSVESFAHVRNLVSTYLRFRKGERPNVVWRLHYLWYLELLAGEPAHLVEATAAMDAASSAVLQVGDYVVDMAAVDATCANVLEDELESLEGVLIGEMRPEVRAFIDAYRSFLERHGAGSGVVEASVPE